MRVSRRCSPCAFAREFSKPSELRAQLFDHAADHPDRLMIAVANLLPDRAQCLFFALHFFLQELLPPPQLLLEDSRSRLPGQSHPREKGGPLPLRGPFLAPECSRERAAPLRAWCENAAFRPGRRIRILGSANQALRL